ncbi:MAG: hypothetical protein ACRCY3_04610 [Sphingorhabdus sp.]
MMKRQLALTSAMAATLATLSACSAEEEWNNSNSDVFADRDTAVCVDQSGNRIDDDYCESNRLGGGAGWYYLGRGSRMPYLGDNLRNRQMGFYGSSTPAAGVDYARAPASTAMTRSAAVARGGFGSSGRSYGGGRS